MLGLVFAFVLLLFFVFLFVREVRLDRARFKEQDRLGDEHIMRVIEKFLKEKGKSLEI
ncbi:MAG: hypothetical protein JST78_01605 [Bacteroidetes bacterium]|nr:hypothetical protein [Bacteroidota bacterium]